MYISYNDYNPDEYHLLDVREKHEYETYNVGGLNIPLGELPDRLSELKSFKKQKIAVLCQFGLRSPKACQLLKNEAFTKVRIIYGGIVSWPKHLIEEKIPPFKHSKRI